MFYNIAFYVFIGYFHPLERKHRKHGEFTQFVDGCVPPAPSMDLECIYQTAVKPFSWPHSLCAQMLPVPWPQLKSTSVSLERLH